jgi:HK97 family phage prohead protease
MKEKEFLSFKFKVDKAESDARVGYIEGYASTFGNVDLGDDIVERGAFTRTIKNNNGRFPILLDHDSTKQIGWNVEATEDDRGLKVKGMVNLITEEAQNRYELAKQAQELGTQMGLSIGYSTIKSEPDFQNQNIRRLKELKLYEYSFVTFPMNTMAGITAAKFQNVVQLFDRLQKDGYDLTRLEEALKKLGIDQPISSLANPKADSELLHSVDTVTQRIRALI